MKTKVYRNKNLVCRTYLKPVGNGWEAGFVVGGTPIFLGNFIHKPEAIRWYAVMNREIRLISRKFALGREVPITWFRHLVKNHLYKTYYAFVDRLLVRHRGEFNRGLVRDLRQFKKIRRAEVRRGVTRRVPLLKVA
jgi:hypothetical protein